MLRLGAVLFYTLCPALYAAAMPPNIVLILVDDMGWSNIGCYGGMVETPNLDKLAENGVRFSQFYNAARCCPTRASIMTGLHPHQTGVGHMILPVRGGEFALTKADRAHIPPAYQGWLSVDVPTLPEMLREAGYGTNMTGKWHLAAPDQATWPIQRGYDRFYGHLAGTSDFFVPENLYRDNEHIQASGDRYYITDAITNEAIRFLEEHHTDLGQAKPTGPPDNRQPTTDNSGKPFFLYLAYNAPHFPVQCMPEEYEKYRGRFMKGWDILRKEKIARQKEMGLIPPNTKLAPHPGKGGPKGNRGGGVSAWDSLDEKKQDKMDAIMATYAGMIDRVDQNIGKVVAYLKETGELDNTLIFFLSDNGGEAETGPLGQFEFENLGQYGKGGMKYGKAWATLSNTPFREYKHFTHQGGIQTPLIVHWPAGIKEDLDGSILHEYGYLPDLVETCLDLAGATRPAEKNGKPVPEGEGVSLAGLLQGEPGPVHTEPICIEHEGNRIVRHGKWKLVAYYDKPWELFDMDSDRSESNDLATQHPEVIARLSKAYNEWADRAGVIPWDEAQSYSVYKQKPKK